MLVALRRQSQNQPLISCGEKAVGETYSEEATSGSVIAKADLIVPSKRGTSHFSFCAGVPYLASTSVSKKISWFFQEFD